MSLRLWITPTWDWVDGLAKTLPTPGNADVCVFTLKVPFLADLRLSDWTLPQRHRSVNLE